MQLSAAQHVSAILTARQSPRKEMGFQTLFYSRNLLGDDDARVIEAQIQGAPLSKGAAKWQSYKLSSNRHVISRVVSIPEPDEVGRFGRFFAISLIFNTKDVAQFDDWIFYLLRCKTFHLPLDELLASENAQTRNAPPVAVEARGEWVAEAESLARVWPADQLNVLFTLMARPDQLTARGEFVTLVGSDEQIIDALKVAFLLAPADVRPFCSFDTCVAASAGHKGVKFWGQGCVKTASANCVIDAAQRSVLISQPFSLPKESASLMNFSPLLRGCILEDLNHRSSRQAYLNRSYRAFVAESIYETLLKKPELITADDVQQLMPLGQFHSGLALWLTLRTGDEAKRLKLLATMDLYMYRARISELRNAPEFKPWQVFSPIFIPTWFALFRTSYSLTDLTKAISTVAQYGSAEDLDQLKSLAEHLNPDEREALRTWLQTSSHVLTNLQSGLEARSRIR